MTVARAVRALCGMCYYSRVPSKFVCPPQQRQRQPEHKHEVHTQQNEGIKGKTPQQQMADLSAPMDCITAPCQGRPKQFPACASSEDNAIPLTPRKVRVVSSAQVHTCQMSGTGKAEGIEISSTSEGTLVKDKA